jgi:hypothetical protein
MSSQNPTGVVPTVDSDITILDRLSALASTVMNTHGNDADLCAVCGSAWPCDSVVLADHNLAVL